MKDRLIIRQAIRIMLLEEKLERIRGSADIIYQTAAPNSEIKFASIDIINEIDTDEDEDE